jgi:ribonuclease P protein component
VRGSGKTTAHPLVVLVVADGIAENSRAGIITSKSLGTAVERNRTRRRLRAILSTLLPRTTRRVDVLLIARKPILKANFYELRKAVIQLFVREKCLEKNELT